MTATIETRRGALDQLISSMLNTYVLEGEIYADDLNTLMERLNLLPALYGKVSNTVEQILFDKAVADALTRNLRSGWRRYYYTTPYPGDAVASSALAAHTKNAETGINLIVGLAALS